MATVRRNPDGPLRFSLLVQIEDALFWDKTRPPKIEKDDTDSTYMVKIGDRHDFLAFHKLGSSQMGHIIMERNGMRLWPNDFVPGRQIAIPSRDSLAARNII